MSRQGIGKAQYLAGREYQKHAGIVDGEPGALERCHRELGADGTAPVHDMLISAMSTKQVAESRGMAGEDAQRFYAKRFLSILQRRMVSPARRIADDCASAVIW
jgi:hypothetical protein